MIGVIYFILVVILPSARQLAPETQYSNLFVRMILLCRIYVGLRHGGLWKTVCSNCERSEQPFKSHVTRQRGHAWPSF